jgi:hypothetical protein
LEASKLLAERLGPFENTSKLEKLTSSKVQKTISESIDQQSLQELLSGSSNHSKSRIYSCMGSHGSLLINSPLAPIRGFRFLPQEFSFFLSSRLGVPNLCTEGDSCSTCKHVLDPQGYHFATCKTGEDSAVHRHHTFRNILFQQCQKAAWNPKLEVMCANGTTHLTPADIYIPTGPGSKPVAIDVTIVHPQANVPSSSKGPDHANLKAEEKKNLRYLESCRKADITFQPLAMEYFGRFSPNSKSFFFKVATGIANRCNGSASSIAKDIERRIFVAHIKQCARSVLIRSPQLIF